MTNIRLLEKHSMSKDQITEIAQESAKYLLDIFAKEDTDTFLAVCTLVQCCMERNEIAAYVKTRMYCRKKGYELPEHYNEIAADTDAFDFYCRQLLYYMIDLSR